MALEMDWWPESMQLREMGGGPRIVSFLAGAPLWALGFTGAVFTKEVGGVLKQGGMPKLVELIAGKNYDEALLRSYNDKVNGWWQLLCRLLMGIGATVLTMLHYCGNAGLVLDLGRLWGPITLFVVAYTFVMRTRLKTAMDSEVSFPIITAQWSESVARKMHALYPVIDTRTAFLRTVTMDDTNSLRQKQISLSKRYLRRTIVATALALPLVFTLLSANFFDQNKLVLNLLHAFVVWALLTNNWGFIRVFDNFQQYLSIEYLRVPIKSIQSLSIRGTIEQWALEGALPKPHYNHFNSFFKPWSEYVHNNVYKVARKDYGYSIGKAMAAVVSVKATAMTFALIMLYGRDVQGEVNSDLYRKLLKILTCYYAHAMWLYMYEDDKLGDEAFLRYLKRDSDTKKAWFNIYRIAFGVVDQFLFYQPLLQLAFATPNPSED